MRFGFGALLAPALVLVLTGCAPPLEGAGSKIEAQVPVGAPNAAVSLHEGLMVLDSHLDTPAYFHGSDYVFSEHGTFEKHGTHVDLPRMKTGGLDGGFWVIFTRQGPLNARGFVSARNSALMRQMAIREFAAKYSDDVELAFSADDADRIVGAGKRVVFQSMENAYPLGEDVSLLEAFYTGGLRMLGPVHFANNQFADSATDASAIYDGLSPLGEDLVREANRLGLILDGSHASDAALRDMMALSTTPIILSHTGPRAVYDHARNIPDALLLELAANGGVIHINALGAYLEALEPNVERDAARAAVAAEFDGGNGTMTAAEFRTARKQIDREHPAPRSSFEVFMAHLLYTLDLIGPQHVGIGADWDGGGGVDGMKDVSFLPKVTEALLAAGYSEDDLAAIWGGNMLRLMRAAEAARTVDVASPASIN